MLAETGPMTTLPYVEDRRRPAVPREGALAVTLTSCNAETLTESFSLRTVPVWMKANGRKVKINAILGDASNETFLNEEVAGVLGLQEPFQKVQVRVINDTVETFQSMPLKVEVEGVDGRFSKEISVKTSPQKVTGNYRVVSWSEHQNKWPHLTQCSFAKPANNGLVDLLIGIDNAELHYSHVDLRGRDSGPIAKRNVLRKVATIFDPLEFVCPYVIVAKILLQELWMRGYDWDDEIQDEIANKIGNWFEQLKSLRDVKIPRCLRSPEPVKSKRIVTFVDASQQAYGAAVYIRCEYHNDAVTSRLITAKSKVAPLTPMTVPRLGAILGFRLTQSLLTVLDAPMQSVTFYSDSTDVLWWTRGRGKDFRPFVTNRIGEIQMFTEPSQWQHVSTEENRADLCTRGATPSELAECSLWWNGPDWLTKDFREWSKM